MNLFNLVILLFAGGPATFDNDLLIIELGLITVLLLLAYGGRMISYTRTLVLQAWHKLFHHTTESDFGPTE